MRHGSAHCHCNTLHKLTLHCYDLLRSCHLGYTYGSSSIFTYLPFARFTTPTTILPFCLGAFSITKLFVLYAAQLNVSLPKTGIPHHTCMRALANKPTVTFVFCATLLRGRRGAHPASHHYALR